MNRNTIPLAFACLMAFAAIQIGGIGSPLASSDVAGLNISPQTASYETVAPDVEARAQVVIADQNIAAPQKWQALLYSEDVTPRAIPVSVTTSRPRESATHPAYLNGKSDRLDFAEASPGRPGSFSIAVVDKRRASPD